MDIAWGVIRSDGADVEIGLDFHLSAGRAGARGSGALELPFALAAAADLDTSRAAGLAPGSRFLVAPAASFRAREDYFAAAERLDREQGLFFVWDPEANWGQPFASYYLANGFVLSGGKLRSQQSVVNYYLRQGFRAAILGFSSAQHPLFVGVKGDEAASGAALSRALRAGRCFLSRRRSLELELSVGGQGVGATVTAEAMGSVQLDIRVAGGRHGETGRLVKNGDQLLWSSSLDGGETRLSVRDSVWGPAFYCLEVADDVDELVALTNPLQVRTAGVLRGDHHVHFVNPAMLSTRSFDYVVFGEYTVWGGEWDGERAAALGLIRVPGGELHGSGAPGEPWDPHVLILQRDSQKRYQDHMGFHQTLEEAKRNGDLAFLAHPRIFGAKVLPHGSPRPGEPEFDPSFTGLEIVNTAPKNIMRLGIEHGVAFAQDALDHAEAEAMWDSCLAMGQRVTGIANSDCHGVWRDGMHANNLRLGTNPTFVVVEGEPSVDTILDALQKGSCWFTTGDARFLRVELGGRTMGEVCPGRGQVPLGVLCESHTPLVRLEVVSGGELKRSASFAATNRLEWRGELEVAGLERYVRVRLCDLAGGVTYSNPVYTEAPRGRGE